VSLHRRAAKRAFVEEFGSERELLAWVQERMK